MIYKLMEGRTGEVAQAKRTSLGCFGEGRSNIQKRRVG